MSVSHSDLPPTYSSLTEEVVNNLSVLHSDLPPTYSTLNLSPDKVDTNVSVQQRVLPSTDVTLNVLPEEMIVNFNHGTGASTGNSSRFIFMQKVTMATVITTAMSVVLRLLVVRTKYDSTMMEEFLCYSKIILLLLGVPSIFTRNKYVLFFYGCSGVLIFWVYLICDTQLMRGGEHSSEEYTFVAFNLDIVNTFLYILLIVNVALR